MASNVNTDRETLRRATKLFTLQRIGPNIQTLEVEAFLFRPLGGFVREEENKYFGPNWVMVRDVPMYY